MDVIVRVRCCQEMSDGGIANSAMCVQGLSTCDPNPDRGPSLWGVLRGALYLNGPFIASRDSLYIILQPRSFFPITYPSHEAMVTLESYSRAMTSTPKFGLATPHTVTAQMSCGKASTSTTTSHVSSHKNNLSICSAYAQNLLIYLLLIIHAKIHLGIMKLRIKLSLVTSCHRNGSLEFGSLQPAQPTFSIFTAAATLAQTMT